MAIALGVVDFIWVKKDWIDDLRMTHQEVKDEMKQSEGDPTLKMRARSVARNRARHRMIGQVSEATLVIVNPTHYSIAMRYDPDQDPAPKILAKGQDIIALKIREIAEDNGIPVIEDRKLARAMYKEVDVDTILPIEFYMPVASIIKALNKT